MLLLDQVKHIFNVGRTRWTGGAMILFTVELEDTLGETTTTIFSATRNVNINVWDSMSKSTPVQWPEQDQRNTSKVQAGVES